MRAPSKPAIISALLVAVVLSAMLPGCRDANTGTRPDTADTTEASDSSDKPEDSDDGGADVDVWSLDSVPEPVPTSELEQVRGLRRLRGIIHSHTPYSHDACDGEPRDADGALKEDCLDDFRRGVCATEQDFVFNTDHEETAARVEFEDLLLVRGDDEVITRNGNPVANRMDCENGHRPLLLPGGEFGVMPVGLNRHIDGTAAERESAYEDVSAETVGALKQLGAVVLQAHTESRDVETLAGLGLDGFEIYNLHANLDPDIREDFLGLDPGGYLADMLTFARSDELPPDLLFLTFFEPNQPSLDAFDTLLARGQHLVGTAGTDSHQNVLDTKMNDGERGDSFRRLMRWFSNYVLVDDITPSSVKNALRDGRSYVVFEILGTPKGFDFRADTDGTAAEMGETVRLDDDPTLVVEAPEVHGLKKPVEVTVRLMRSEEGGAVEVASGADSLSFAPEAPGAYRAEVLIVPLHLRALLGERYGEAAQQEFVWIYANPIYVE